MKKIYLALSLLLASTLVTQARDFDYLTFLDVSGSERSVPVEGLKITFADGKLHASAASENVAFELSQLREMFFSLTPTGISSVGNDEVKVGIVDGQLRVDAPAGSRIAVYAADGRLVEGRTLTRGLYIVKVNDKTYKLLAR